MNNNNPCSNAAIQLSAVQTGFANGNSYTYSWTANPQPGSGLPASPTANASITVTPTTPGTYTYTASGADGACVATATVIVTVKSSPTNVVASNTTTPCVGGTTMLSSSFNSGLNAILNYSQGFETYPPAGWTFINAGSGNTWVASTTLTTPTPHTGANAMAYLFNTNSAANAWGITPGQNLVAGITYTISFWYNTSSVSGAFPEKLKVTVGTLATVAAQTNILWNNNGGSSLINETYAQGTATFTPSASGIYYFGFNCYSDADEDGLFVDDISITGDATPPSTFSWTSNPAGFTSNVQNPPAPVTVNITTTYSVTTTNAVGCSATGSVTVTPHELPATPSPLNGTGQCGTALSDASVSSNSGEPTPTFNWYQVPTGGSPVQTGTSTTYLMPISTTTTFYVSEISSFGCEGSRATVSTEVSDPDILTVNATSTSVCLGGSTDISSVYTPFFNSFATFDLTATGGAVSGVTGTVSLTPNQDGTGTDPYTIIPTASGTYTYTITAFDPDKGCISVNTVTVTVSVLPVIDSTTTSPAVVCAGSPTTLNVYSGIITSGPQTAPSGYLSSNATNTSDEDILNVTFSTLNNTSTCTSTGGAGSILNEYSNFTTIPAPTVTAGQSVPISVQVGTCGGTFSNWTNVFIDYNRNGTFEANERVYTSATSASGAHLESGSVLIPLTAAQGVTLMRVMVVEFGTNTDSPTGTYSWGETEDYLVNIRQVVTQNPAYTYTWNPGALNGATVTANPVATTTYTATVTNPAGCSANSTVTVTVNPLPAAPATNDPVIRCGPGSVTLTATGTGGTLKWYNVASGGTALQTGGTYTLNVPASTIYYVAETSAAGCEGPRSAVNVTVNTAPALVINPSGATTFCQGSAVTLNGASGSSNSYINFNWSASPSTGSGLSSTTGAIVTATPTVSGTYTYTLTADDGAVNGCSNTATVVVTVNANPVIASATASASTVCAGGASTLSATTNIIGAGSSSSLGTATTLTTASATDPTAFNNRYSQYWGQYLYTAAELHAAGLQAGNITGITFNINTLGDAASNSNFSVSIAATSATTLSAFVTTGLAQVLAPTTYTHAVGLNTITFTTPYNWDGVSNLIIDQRHDGADLSNNARTFFTATSGNTVVSAVTTTSSSTTSLQTEVQNAVATPSLSVKRLNIIFTGQVSTSGPGTLNYTWNPGNLPGSSITVNPTSTTTYTVTGTNPSTGCSATGTPVTVTVTPVGANATASPSTPVCAGTSVTLNGGATGGGPFTYSWSDGTAVVGTTSPLTVNPTVTTTYTVTVTDNCNNPTTSSVTVSVNPLPTAVITPAGPISICAPSTQLLTVTTNAASATYQWQLNGTNIAGATASTYTVTGVSTGTYRVIVTNTANKLCKRSICRSSSVTINPQPNAAVTITPPTATICNGAIVAALRYR